MAYELGQKLVIDTEEFNNFAIGLTLPLQRGNTGYFAQSFTTTEQVRSNIINLLKTKRGERLFQPEFGSGLHGLLFEQATDTLEEDIEETINSALEQCLPYVVAEEINIDISKEMTDFNQASVSIKFKLEGQQTLDTVTFVVSE